ncbi:hypothetical protein [Hoeflea poritis]|uniref:Uncharacterized protein n=1 Tax=Hoeflea poritis TaxID=2993659 RepID=A0ABT4VTI9_9HYPH|nr:hypothetical protein [Hoeflea poritis]MDA4848009.1 hypothetical protein [Hoeflea poritis]
MKAFETAIRKALQKIDGTNAKLRERVYQSARDALTNSQAKQGIWGSDAAAAQNRRLQDLIAEIEAEYIAPLEPEPQPRPVRRAPKPEIQDIEPEAPPLPEPPPPPPPRPTARQQPQRPPAKPAAQKRPPKERIRWSEPEPEIGGNLDVESVGPVDPPPPGKNKRRKKKRADASLPDMDLLGESIGAAQRPGKQKRQKRRRPVFSLILVSALVISFLGIGILWAVYSGIFLSEEQRDTSVPNPPAKIEGGDFAGNPPADGTFSGDWIEVFTPDNISGVSGRGAATAVVVESNGAQALQSVSADPGVAGEILFELSPAVLRNLAGQKSLVAITLRSSTEEPTQIYVKCELAGDGSCGRHRFDVNYETGDIVFSIDLTGRAADGASGFLALNSDVTGKGLGVDIYAIRMRPQ